MKLRLAKKIWKDKSGWCWWMEDKYSSNQLHKSSKVFLNYIVRNVRDDSKKGFSK